MNTETGPQTIQRVLSKYEIGGKLRQLRLRKKIALADLGKHTKLSPSLLSQLENGKMIPTLPTLVRIAMVLDVSLDYFFETERGRKLFSVVRASERMRFPERADCPTPAYFFECLTFAAQGQGLHAYLAEFPGHEDVTQTEYVHEGVEFLFILEGALTIRHQGEEHEVGVGDSVLMDSTAPHSYRGNGPGTARAIVVTAESRI